MATWIVHLRLAENLLRYIDGLDASNFAIGNVAPDSGVPDENWEHFDPPPEVSHFEGPDEANWRLADLDFDYVRANPQTIFWRVFLACDCHQDHLPFLPPVAVQQRITYIQDLYQRTDQKIEDWYIQRPGLYMTATEMDIFLQTATSLIERIYRYLWSGGVDVPHGPSALELTLDL